MSKAEEVTVVDLFSGCGGMSHGFKKAGFSIRGAVDLQVAKPGRGRSNGTRTDCNGTFERNIGISPLEADLSVLPPRELRRATGLARGELTVLISCAPCTGFSQKNAANHTTDDPRNLLVPRTAEFVAEFQPEFLVMENVKELILGNQRHHFSALADRLMKLGYSIAADAHDLSDFGLPQRRKRALVVARRRGPVIGLSARTGVVRTVRDAISHLPPIAAGERHPEDEMHVCPRASAQVLDRMRAIPKDGGSWGDVMADPNLSEAEKRYLLIPSMFNARPGSFPDVYGRLWWDRPAITVTRECGHVGNGRYSHPEQDRLLSVREMGLLQGFPSDYVFEGRLASKYNQIGDAVPPHVSHQIANHVVALREGSIDVDAELARRKPQLVLFGENSALQP